MYSSPTQATAAAVYNTGAPCCGVPRTHHVAAQPCTLGLSQNAVPAVEPQPTRAFPISALGATTVSSFVSWVPRPRQGGVRRMQHHARKTANST